MRSKILYIIILSVLIVSNNILGQTSPTTFTVPGAGTFTVPCGVTHIVVQCWGAGGAGGGSNNNASNNGGGGGGGAYTISTLTVVSGQVINYFVGAGGVGANNTGANGEQTFFSTVTANGGTGGQGGNVASGAGGAGGLGGTYSGGNGASGLSTSYGGGGGSSAGTASNGNTAIASAGGVSVIGGGAGGAGATTNNTVGNPGLFPGGGGGGADRGSNNRAGGSGANGQIIITWQTPNICIGTTTTETITTCGVSWTDDGGIGANYAANQSYTKTFCPSSASQTIKVDFSSFNTEGGGGTCTDFMEMWMGNSATGPAQDTYCDNLGAFTLVSTSPDGCVTLRFTSNATTSRAGWASNISCVSPCVNPISSLTTSSEVNICNSSAMIPGNLDVVFNASASTAAPTWSVSRYEWEWGDGSTSITTSPIATHTFPAIPNTGIYATKLFVRDNNFSINPLGCISTNSTIRKVTVLPPATFTGVNSVSPLPNPPITLTCSQFATLTANASSQTVSETPISPPPPNISLPDGVGISYVSGIDFSGFFPVGETITSSCFPTVNFNLEHTYSGDLTIDLIAPNGQIARLFNQHGSGNNFGTCANPADDGVPGCGADYTIVNSGGVSWTGAGVTSTSTSSSTCSTYTGTCETGGNYISQVYNSTTPFTTFTGAPINGIWQIRITDNLAIDDGTLFSWGLSFPTPCYRPLESKTPDIVSLEWYHPGLGPVVPIVQPTNVTTISDPGPHLCQIPGTCIGTQINNQIVVGPFDAIGTYTYYSRATDEYGCYYDRAVDVIVSKPKVIVPTSFTICAGAVVPATTFTSTPISTATTYEWSNSNTLIGLPATGTGNIASFTATNLTTASIVATIIVTPTLGCAGIPSTYTIRVNPTPTILVTATSSSICLGEITTLTASGASSYTWSPNIDLSSTTGPTVVSTPTASITYTVTGLTTATCSGIVTKTITVSPVATATISGTTSVCPNTTGVLTFTGTPNGTVNYTVNSGPIQTLTIDVTGISTVTTSLLTSTTTYTLVSSGFMPCLTTYTNEFVVVNISPTTPPITSFTYTTPICINSTNVSPTLASSFTFGGNFLTTSGLELSAVSGEIDVSLSSIGTYIVTYTFPSSGCNVGGLSTFSVTITDVSSITNSTAESICNNGTLAIDLESSLPSTYSWIAIDNSNIVGESLTSQTNGTINNTLVNTTNTVQLVTYTIIPTTVIGLCVGASKDIVVSVNPTPTLLLTATQTSICAGQSTTLTVSGASTYTWSPNTSLSSINGSSVVANPNQNITYTVTGISATNCTTTTSIAINITPSVIPVTSFTYPISICKTAPSVLPEQATGFVTGGTYSSTLGLSLNTATGLINPSLSTVGDYIVTYTVSSNGCNPSGFSTEMVSIISLSNPTTGFSYNSPVCVTSGNISPTLELGLTTGGIFSSTSGVVVDSNTGQINVASSLAGTYVITYSVLAQDCFNAGQGTASVIISDDFPLVYAGLDLTIACNLTQIETNNESVGAGATYSWIAATGLVTPSSTLNAIFNEAGEYTLNATNPINGCVASDKVIVKTEEKPIANFSTDLTNGIVPLTVSFTNLSNSASTSFTWDFGDLSSSTEKNTSYTYNKEGEFFVVLTASNGNLLCNDTASVTIIVDEIPKLVIPNVFSPNNDNINDRFEVTAKSFAELEIIIYNRWGKKITSYNALNSSWDGGNSPDGVYFYLLKGKDITGKMEEYNGSFTLLR